MNEICFQEGTLDFQGEIKTLFEYDNSAGLGPPVPDCPKVIRFQYGDGNTKYAAVWETPMNVRVEVKAGQLWIWKE